MSDLQRWSMGISEQGIFQRHDDTGHWVEYEQAADLIEQQQARITELQATIGRLRDTAEKIQHWHDAHDDGMVVSAESVRGLWEALEATPHQNLNHVKRDVAIEAYLQSASDFCVEDDVSFEAHQYAEHKYPSIKDGE